MTLLLEALVSSASGLFAADILLPVSPGWMIEPGTVSFSYTHDVFVVALRSGGIHPGYNKLVQFRGIESPGMGTVITTDVPGSAFSVEISTDGEHVLVHSATAPDDESDSLATLIDSAGDIVWSEHSNLRFRFSTTGQVLAAHLMSSMSIGSVASAYGLDGTLIKEMSISRSLEGGGSIAEAFQSLLLEGDGGTIILATRDRIWRKTFSDPSSVIWSTAISNCDSNYQNVKALDAERIVADRNDGGFELIRVSDGSVEYVYDPKVLDENDGDESMTRGMWSSYKPFAGAEGDSVVLFNGTADGFTLNIATGEMSTRTFNVTAAAGSHVHRGLSGPYITVLSPTQIRLRSIDP